MNERMKINPAEAAAAGEADARSLADAMQNAEEGDNHGELMSDALAEIIGLAVENRIEECTARLEAFCGLVGPSVYTSFRVALTGKDLIQAGSQWPRTDDEARVVDAAIATCSRVTEGRIIAAHPKDDDATVTLAELQLAVRAIEPKLTETEGVEL
jgi:hypothetical protein